MLRHLAPLLLLLIAPTLHAQNLNGQWRGGFGSQSVLGNETEYVLDLEIAGDKVGGLSYSYFIIGGKRCYVICKLDGIYDKAARSLTVTETEKIKSNTPPDFRDCLQIHYLTFMKQGSSEFLRGRWKGARPQDNCGTGETELERKLLVKVTPEKTKPVTPPTAQTTKPKTATPATTTPQTNNSAKKSTPSVATAPAKPKTSTPAPTIAAPPATSKTATIDNTLPQTEKPQVPANKILAPLHSKLVARPKNLIQTLEVPEKKFRVDLYDNGQVDGDTISVFYNGRMVVEKQRLSTTPITLEIDLDPGRNDNDLVMYAENLGSIPPNTALMVVTVAGKRYEVNITSTEQTSGTVRFRLKETP